MTGAEERVWQARMESLIWSRDSVNIGPSMTGAKFQIEDKVIGAYVQHQQERTAQVRTVRKGDELNSEEDQDHNNCHGAEGSQWLAARLSSRQQRRGWQECDGRRYSRRH